jgi:hypothetical protein
MRVDVEQDVRATWPREMVLEFVRQQQRIQGNWPLVGVRGSPSAWRYGERGRVLHDAAQDPVGFANDLHGGAVCVHQSSKSVIARGYGGPALEKRSKHRDTHSAYSTKTDFTNSGVALARGISTRPLMAALIPEGSLGLSRLPDP